MPSFDRHPMVLAGATVAQEEGQMAEAHMSSIDLAKRSVQVGVRIAQDHVLTCTRNSGPF